MTGELAGPWSGAWVAERLGVELHTNPDSLLPLGDLVGMALRRNPKRAHLLVSTVLGKHVPTDPALVYGSGRLLGALVVDALTGIDSGISSAATLLAESLNGVEGAAQALVAACERHAVDYAAAVPAGAIAVGYAETATALGHAVADGIGVDGVGVDYVHSTRRAVPGVVAAGGFDEEHSHAARHLLLPEDPELLRGHGPLIFVDDELSTGQTVLNTIALLHRTTPRAHYVIASLVDLRSAADRARMAAMAAELGIRIDAVALSGGGLTLADGAAETARELVEAQPEGSSTGVEQGRVRRSAARWPVGVREGGRHGFRAADKPALDAAAQAVARTLRAEMTGPRILVLGFEELMYAPLRIAMALGEEDPAAAVRFSTTTRSPVLAVADDGYAIRSTLRFPSHDGPDDGPGNRYAHNVAPAGPGHARFDDIVLVVDDRGDTEELSGLLEQLQSVCGTVHLVVIPSYRPLPAPLYGPEFGSYARDEVAWLLTDLSAVRLEAPTEEREEAIQAGRAHYAESLPVEYQPSPEYQQLFADALAESASRIAHAVGVVTELVLDARGEDAVLVSLARAGTPVGILMRRWAQFARGVDLPHYAVSIVRGRGLDPVALRYLAEHHDPASIMFVDGWTGKGAISRELDAAVAAANAELGGRGFSADLAVLADPGSCVEIFGTRDDFLIPSACLNSTVSGLISRTVLNDELIGPNQFHGAKFYAELLDADVSAVFLDAVTAEFAAVCARVQQDWPALRDADRAPTWAGWAAVESISEAYGINNVNLVKPGVGETTRVLLRRVPWRVLIRRGAAEELGHILLLARQRGVEIEEVDDLPFRCVGLIHPNFTRGATGADGRAVDAS